MCACSSHLVSIVMYIPIDNPVSQVHSCVNVFGVYVIFVQYLCWRWLLHLPKMLIVLAHTHKDLHTVI